MQRSKVVVCMLMLAVITSQTSASTEPGTSTTTYKQKIKELSQLIKQKPTDAMAYAERASLKMKAIDVYSAIKDYTAAIELSSGGDANFFAGRGNAFLEIGAYKEALRDFDASLTLASATEAKYGRAVARYYLDDYFGAIRDLDEVVMVAPEHPKALYNRAIVKMQLNKLEEAIVDLNAFLTYHPGHSEAANALAVTTSQLERRFVKR